MGSDWVPMGSDVVRLGPMGSDWVISHTQGSAPDPAGWAYSTPPDSLAGFKNLKKTIFYNPFLQPWCFVVFSCLWSFSALFHRVLSYFAVFSVFTRTDTSACAKYRSSETNIPSVTDWHSRATTSNDISKCKKLAQLDIFNKHNGQTSLKLPTTLLTLKSTPKTTTAFQPRLPMQFYQYVDKLEHVLRRWPKNARSIAQI